MKGSITLSMSRGEAKHLLFYLHQYIEYKNYILPNTVDTNDPMNDLINALHDAIGGQPTKYWSEAKDVTDEMIRRFEIDRGL